MGSLKVMIFLGVFLVWVPIIALGDDDLSPAFAPFSDRICDEVECGEGKCVTINSYPWYKCQCNSGWKHARTEIDDDNDNDDLSFLPCIIPNCTLNYNNCTLEAPPPVPEKNIPNNISAFDPCYWTYCGGGTCKTTSTYKHICECNNGFTNLLNKTYFPCYSTCTLGSDCERIINVAKDENSPAVVGDSNHGVTSFIVGNVYWMTVLTLSIAMVM